MSFSVFFFSIFIASSVDSSFFLLFVMSLLLISSLLHAAAAFSFHQRRCFCVDIRPPRLRPRPVMPAARAQREVSDGGEFDESV